MAQSLDQFMTDVRRAANEFEVQWRTKNAATPEQYPMILPTENEGLWFEFFFDYLRNGEL